MDSVVERVHLVPHQTLLHKRAAIEEHGDAGWRAKDGKVIHSLLAKQLVSVEYKTGILI